MAQLWTPPEVPGAMSGKHVLLLTGHGWGEEQWECSLCGIPTQASLCSLWGARMSDGQQQLGSLFCSPRFSLFE